MQQRPIVKKNVMYLLLIFVLVIFGISAFANATNSQISVERLTVTKKYVSEATAFGGRLELPFSKHYVYVSTEDGEFGVKVTEEQFSSLKTDKTYAFEVCRSEVTGKIVRVTYYKGDINVLPKTKK